MYAYLELVRRVLEKGQLKPNRTGVDTISTFAEHYRVNLAEGYPLLTTKKIAFRSMLHETLWYLSGEEHIRNLRQKTRIWDPWANDAGHLETAYGRFWRRYPVPEAGAHLEGEAWVGPDHPFVRREPSGALVFDQIGWIRHELRHNPHSRRLVLTAWHPANAAASKLPPCHAFVVFNVQGGRLNCHLTQRSADIAIGVPFNLAAYSLLTILLARESGLEPGEFAHTLVDAHIYVNHLEGLKEQLKRKPYPLPQLRIADKPMETLTAEDFELVGYRYHEPIRFEVAV